MFFNFEDKGNSGPLTCSAARDVGRSSNYSHVTIRSQVQNVVNNLSLSDLSTMTSGVIAETFARRKWIEEFCTTPGAMVNAEFMQLYASDKHQAEESKFDFLLIFTKGKLCVFYCRFEVGRLVVVDNPTLSTLRAYKSNKVFACALNLMTSSGLVKISATMSTVEMWEVEMTPAETSSRT